MKKAKLISAVSFLLFISLAWASVSHAQLRKDQNKRSELAGPIVKDPSQGANLSNLFNMQMDHSYSMTLSSFGGQTYNMNAYTNTMRFFFSEKLTGRVDLSVLHSPFGNSLTQSGEGMNPQFMIRNAELNYELSENSEIRIQFQQRPAYGANPWSRGLYGNPYNSPFRDQNF